MSKKTNIDYKAIERIKAKAKAELEKRGMTSNELAVWLDGQIIEGRVTNHTPGVMIQHKNGRYVSRLVMPL